MPVFKDYYAILGVPRNASKEQLRKAYREAALRLHPDKNVAAGETELFLDVSRAYEVLSDPAQRKTYDQDLETARKELAERAPFCYEITHSRQSILKLDEPQVHYLLIDIHASEGIPPVRPPVNMSIVVDQSTSMRGQRLDRTRLAALSIIKDLGERDSVSVISFSDRAEMVLTPEQSKDFKTARARLGLLQAGGGTEIAQGMEAGFEALQTNFRENTVNHMVLLTDGRTYGDEDDCVSLATKAASEGITINCVGIGSDWSDRLLDDIASRTGGNVVFMNSPRAIQDLLGDIFSSLGQVVAKRVRIDGTAGQQVDLRSAFRIQPEPMPLGDNLPMMLGNLLHDTVTRVIFEMVIHPIGEQESVTLVDLNIAGDLLGEQTETLCFPAMIQIPVSREPNLTPPPESIVEALNLIALYRMQEKARYESELGQSTQAAKRLENLASHLLAAGERELAKAALNEAVRLSKTQRLSSEGEKVLKYGTRALLLPPSSKQKS